MIDLARYLAAKKSVDDRALNRDVLAEVRRLAPYGRVLEVGAGLGTMVARLLEWQLVAGGEYLLLDVDDELLRDSVGWLAGWAAAHDVSFERLDDGCVLGDLRVRLVHAEVVDYLDSSRHALVDLVIAHAFLDLVEVPAVLPPLLELLAPDGVYWLTVNYDGETVFEPEHPYDEAVLRAFHRDMDERVRHGRPAGESRTGRHLFRHLQAAGAPPVAAGPSDWVVHAAPDGTYPDDEGFFVATILQTIHDALAQRPDRVPSGHLASWLADRQRLLARGQLVYVAHQLDFAGRAPGSR